MKTAVFGGTFDPPHIAHEQIAQRMISECISERVLFVPAFKPPHKEGIKISIFEHRAKMVEIAVSGNENFLFSEIESKMPEGPTYTVHTLKKLQELYPGDELQLLIGSDSLYQLHTWHKADEIVKNYRIISYPRKGEIPGMKELSHFWPQQTARRLHESLIDCGTVDISSTEIRQKIRAGKRVDDFVNPSVLCYILNNKIY